MLGVLKTLGTDGLSTVREELERLEIERSKLRGQLEEIEQAKVPQDELKAECRRFIESWTDIGELLDSANLQEQRVILQHLVEVVELRSTDPTSKRGTYVLKIFAEVGPLATKAGKNANNPASDGAENRVVLTENGLVRQFDEKAPRIEPSS